MKELLRKKIDRWRLGRATNEDGLLKKVERSNYNEFLGIDEIETGETGRIQTPKQYRQLPNGELYPLGYCLFTYFSSGSVQSITAYEYRSPGEWEIVKKTTFESYKMENNPLPFYNEIPGLIFQLTLPLKMTIEEHDHVFTYQFDYVYNDLGKVKEKKVTGLSGTEVNNYVYY